LSEKQTIPISDSLTSDLSGNLYDVKKGEPFTEKIDPVKEITFSNLSKSKETCPPLVSVIIPCYNQGHFLAKSIQSLKEQTYPNIEIIVINDGSTDNTQEISGSFPGIKYVFQENQGLPNARNRGIMESQGKYLAFVDADDWLYPDAIEKNVTILEANPETAFVSGSHSLYFEDSGELKEDHHGEQIEKDFYTVMLERNYIGNPATVLYTKWILDLFPFDNSEKIKGCEDYDHYLKISRRFPVLHHNGKISIYRKHGDNMSDNYPMMLESVLHALKRQEPLLQNESEKIAFRNGMKRWKWIYLNYTYKLILSRGLRNIPIVKKEFLWKHRMGFLKFFIKNILIQIDTQLIKYKIKN
jgi:glycosyltransferase involved in cell wall biosynthesis